MFCHLLVFAMDLNGFTWKWCVCLWITIVNKILIAREKSTKKIEYTRGSWHWGIDYNQTAGVGILNPHVNQLGFIVKSKFSGFFFSGILPKSSFVNQHGTKYPIACGAMNKQSLQMMRAQCEHIIFIQLIVHCFSFYFLNEKVRCWSVDFSQVVIPGHTETETLLSFLIPR